MNSHFEEVTPNIINTTSTIN